MKARLSYMANQIATFFASQPGQDQADRIAAHFRDYWDPRMRAGLLQLLDAGGGDLSPLAREAAARLQRQSGTS